MATIDPPRFVSIKQIAPKTDLRDELLFYGINIIKDEGDGFRVENNENLSHLTTGFIYDEQTHVNFVSYLIAKMKKNK